MTSQRVDFECKKDVIFFSNDQNRTRENIDMATKLNVQFNDRQAKALEDMAEEMGTTKAGVLKTALTLLQVTIRETRDGNALGIINGDKVVKEIVGIK
jgi:hypothetical protein